MGDPTPLNQSLALRDERPPYKPASSAAVVYTRDFAYEDNGPIVVLPIRRMAGQDITSASAKTFAELLSGDTVDIYVGPEKRHWSIHQNLLCHHSPYFELEFSQREVPMKDGKQYLELLDDDPLGFELLVKWLYQGVLSPASDLQTDEAKYDYAVACHKLWLLCDKFDMVRVKNLAMDVYRRCLYESQLVPDADEINEIYRRSPPGSPFRALMVNIAARQIMDPDVGRDLEAYRGCFEANPDFAIELVTAIRHMSGGLLFNDPTHGDPCAYHDHNDTSGCPMQGKGKVRAKKTNGEVKAGIEQPEFPPVELSAEKRTPRKLWTSLKSPEKALRTPNSSSAKLNGPGSRITPVRSVSVDPETSQNVTVILSLETPHNPSYNSNASELSPLHAKSAERQLKTAMSEVRLATDDASPAASKQTPTKSAQEFQQRDSLNKIKHRSSTTPREPSFYNDETVSSRKRKRTPRKIREKHPTTISTSGLSSRADSVIGGPRKLRVNSMVRRLEEKGRTGSAEMNGA